MTSDRLTSGDPSTRLLSLFKVEDASQRSSVALLDGRPPKTPTSVSKTSASASGARRTSGEDFIRESSTCVERRQPVAPMANMAGPSTHPPSASRQSTLWERMPPPTPASKGSGKKKARVEESAFNSIHRRRPGPRQSQDYQEEADKIERARDEEDPDFFSSPTPQEDHRKRKRTSDPPESGPSSKAPKTPRPSNQYYAKSKPETQLERDEHIRRITENWSTNTDTWMPNGLAPIKRVKGGHLKALPPKDWNTNLLAELAYLSQMTRWNVTKAREELRAAVARKDRLGGGPQVLLADVRYAIKKCQSEDAGRSSEPEAERSFSPMMAGALPNDDGEVVQPNPPRNEETVMLDGHDASPVRSTTLTREHASIKKRSVALALRPSTPPDDVLDECDYDSEMEKLRECKLRMEAKEAERDAKSAALEYYLQKRKVQQRMRQRGARSEDAIAL